MKFKLYPESFIKLELGRNKNNDEYWFTILFKKTKNKNDITLTQFCFEKETFAFFQNKNTPFTQGTQEELDELLSCQEGKDIIEQLTFIGNELPKLKELINENTNLHIEEEKLVKGVDGKISKMKIKIDNSPLVIDVSYYTTTGKFYIGFSTVKNFKQNCFMILPKEDTEFCKDIIFTHISKYSKQRIRILTDVK